MKDKPLTIKQKKFVKAYVKHDGNGQEAVKEVYSVTSDKSASVISSQNLAKLNVKQAIDLSLEKHGITMDVAIKPIADGLTATRTVVNGDHEIGLEVADHSIRLKASGMALKLMGADKGEAQVPAAVHFHQHIEEKKGDYDF